MCVSSLWARCVSLCTCRCRELCMCFNRCLCSLCLTPHTPKKNRIALSLLFYNYLLTVSHPHLHHMSICFSLCLCIPIHACVCVCFISLIAKDIHLAVEISFGDQAATQFCLLFSWVIVLIAVQCDSAAVTLWKL